MNLTADALAARLREALSCGRAGCGCAHPTGLLHCPAHDDTHPSLSITVRDNKVLLHCHASCAQTTVLDALRARGLWPENPPKPRRIAAVYNYTDPDGTLLFQVVRFRPKDFRQRRPGRHGRWVWSLDGIERVIYRLPQVLEAGRMGRTVYIVEGERDADALATLDLVATTNPGGAGKWQPSYSEALRGAHVIILPDKDAPGREHAAQVARALYGVAASVKVLELPGDGKDVSDWLAAGGTREELERLADQAPEWAPPATPEAEAPPDTHSSDAYHQTDLGNAERFVAAHGQDLRYCYAWGKWFAWDGRQWREDATGEVERRAKATVRAMYTEAAQETDGDRRTMLARHALRSEARERVRAMVDLARSEVAVRPDELDANPWLFNVANGTVDLRTGALRPHDRDDLITKLVPIAYSERAEAPLWHAFLDRIFAGNQEIIAFLQRAVGYSLTGDVSEHALFLCYGTGANGKTVFLRTLLNLLGPYGKPVEPDLLLIRRGEAHPTGIADLMGARMVVALETGEGRRLNEALVKWLTGGDKLKARFMRQDFFEFEPSHKLWLATNHKPVIRGTDHAIWRRIRLIPFSVTIPESEQDPKLVEKLRGELPGILAWAVNGCLEWQRRGLGVPDEVRRATEAYREEQDVLAAFLAECCVVAPTAKAAARELYQAYVAWCEQNGERPEPQRSFGMRLAERGFERYRANGIWWRGVGVWNERNERNQFSVSAGPPQISYRENQENGSVGSVRSVAEGAATARALADVRAPSPPPPGAGVVHPNGPCPRCGFQMVERTCWKCADSLCRHCGRWTGSGLRTVCIPCAAKAEQTRST